MEREDGLGSFKSSRDDIGFESDCGHHPRFQTTFGDSLFRLGRWISYSSDIIAVQATLRCSLLQFFVLERSVPWYSCFEFWHLHIWTTQRLQQIPLVGILPKQQHHDWPDRDAVRSLRHGYSFRHHVRKRSHEFVWPCLRSLKFLFKRDRKHRSGLVGLQLRRLRWASSLDMPVVFDVQLTLHQGDSSIRLGYPLYLYLLLQYFPNQHVPLVQADW